MGTAATSVARAGGRPVRNDALLALAAVVAALVAFAGLVVLPYAVADFEPPAGTDVLWALGAPLTLVLGPVTALLAGAASGWTVWRRRDLGATARRLHLLALAAAAAFVAVLVSAPGQRLLAWWQD